MQRQRLSNDMIALISDIHSNHVALKAVLSDMRLFNIRDIFCLGDIIGYGPNPNKIFPIIKKDKRIKCIIGNYENSILLEKKDCGCEYISDTNLRMAQISFKWTIKNISRENTNYLRTLPKKIRLIKNNKRILMVHGSPNKINGKMDLESSDMFIRKMMKKANADVLFCAHTHLPFHKIVDSCHVINPGSVGRPRLGSPQASYALVDMENDFSVKFRFVDYNYEHFAKEIENSDMPKNNFAEVIRTGYWSF